MRCIVLNSQFSCTLSVADLAAKAQALGFDGTFSVHTEYEFDESIIRRVGFADAKPPNLEEWARADAAYLRRMWAEA